LGSLPFHLTALKLIRQGMMPGDRGKGDAMPTHGAQRLAVKPDQHGSGLANPD